MTRLLLMVTLSLVLALSVSSTNVSLSSSMESCDAEAGVCTATRATRFIPPKVPEARKRHFIPSAPQGPGAPALTAVDTSLPVHVVVRGDVGERLAESLAVQGVEDVLVLPAGLEMSDPLFSAMLSELNLPSNRSIVLFLDDPSTIMLGELQETSRKFQRSGARILLAATVKCRRGCAFDWPVVKEHEASYLDGSAMIAYSGDFASMIARMPPNKGKVYISDNHHITAFFLADGDRAELGMKLDSSSEVFLSLAGQPDNMNRYIMDMKFTYRGVNDTRLKMEELDTYPAVVLGGNNPKLMAQINNYAPMRYHPELGCLHCVNSSDTEGLDAHVFVGIVIDDATPFVDLFFQHLAAQTFTPERMSVGIAILTGPSAVRHAAFVNQWLESDAAKSYAKAELLGQDLSPYDGRAAIFGAAVETEAATHMLQIDAIVQMTEPTMLAHLLNENVPVIGPMVAQDKSAFTNVWGASDGDPDSQCRDMHSRCREWAADNECENSARYMKANCPVSCSQCVGPSTNLKDFAYRRSFDYMDFVSGDRRGLWEVPFVHMALLLDRATFVEVAESIAASGPLPANVVNYKVSVSIAWMLRGWGLRLFADNQADWGILANPDAYVPDKVHPDLFLAQTNEPLWRIKYIHPLYNGTKALDFVDGRCWDIYNFPLFSELFCSQFIEESEGYGQWSGGKSTDKRLKGGYEPVPTRDIHFNQYGFDDTWRFLLRTYVAPVAETQWAGYKLDGRTTLDFIVKYQPEGQPFLRPHHDASTFSINVALNRIGIDFEGGGTRFMRQNCTVLSNQIGHALIHPGRLTHQHEGLYVTKGTRYIIVSFVDQI